MTVYEDIGLKRVINASGKMTALGVSTIDSKVGDYMKQAGMNFIDIQSLIDRADEIIASHTGGEGVCVTAGASAGIVISIAAIIAEDKLHLIENLPLTQGLKNEIILQKGHSVNYGTPVTQMIRLAGGVPVEVGHSNNVEASHVKGAISNNTVALLYVKSHHTVQKGMLTIEKMIKIAHKHDLPLIIDAAAEEDLKKYIEKGADLVIYSGGKAIEGPTSGFITGKKELIEYCKLQYKGVGRAMKVGKMSIMGLLKALELYTSQDSDYTVKEQVAKMKWLVREINKLEGFSATLIQDEAGRKIYRTEVKVDKSILGLNSFQVISLLEEGNPSIYTRNYQAISGLIHIDPRPLSQGEEKIILSRLKEISNQNN